MPIYFFIIIKIVSSLLRRQWLPALLLLHDCCVFEKVFLYQDDNYDDQDNQTDADGDDDDYKLGDRPRGHHLILGGEGRRVRKLVVLLNHVHQAVRDDDPGLAGDVYVGLLDQAPTD